MNSASAATTPMNAQPVRDAFDQAAPTYDQDWSDSIIGWLQRQAVWNAVDPLFVAGDRVLDVGCGTGVDAFHLSQCGVRVHAVDVSPGMVAQVDCRIDREGLSDQVTAEVCAIEDLEGLDVEQPFDGAVSNFSPLNCVEDLEPVAESLGRLIRPDGKLVLCVMTRFCLWETLWYPLTSQLYKAARRWRKANVTATVSSSGEFDVFYHSAGEIEAALSAFRRVGDRGVGIFVPPSYLEPWAERFPRTVKICAAIDRVINRWPLFRSIGDHRLLIFERR